MTELEPTTRISSRMWASAAAAALLLHSGFIAIGMTLLETGDSDPEFGAPAIEIGIDLLTVRGDPTDLPPGPDSEESAASTSAPTAHRKIEQTTLPQETPDKTDDPERLVAPAEAKNPKEEEKVSPSVGTSSSTPSIASEATAMPRQQDAPAGDRSVTPVQGWGSSDQRIRASWQKELVAHLNRYKRYPASQTLDGVEVTVKFVIDDTGHVLSSTIVRGSSEPSFDAAALEVLRRANPVPKPPSSVVQEGLTFTLPIVFGLKGGK